MHNICILSENGHFALRGEMCDTYNVSFHASVINYFTHAEVFSYNILPFLEYYIILKQTDSLSFSKMRNPQINS
ncbi:hypothetical protein V1478_001761 [Vespula squamosa]|uniref:Uncharacterized protein n=1 Tax=Vespula squamosa TaxID=30214 RepID=A0ABD2BY23_VESSQ